MDEVDKGHTSTPYVTPGTSYFTDLFLMLLRSEEVSELLVIIRKKFVTKKNRCRIYGVTNLAESLTKDSSSCLEELSNCLLALRQEE